LDDRRGWDIACIRLEDNSKQSRERLNVEPYSLTESVCTTTLTWP